MIRFLCNDGKGTIDIMQSERRLFDKPSGILKTAFFRRREEDPCINEPGKYGVKIILEMMTGRDRPADLVEPERMIDILKEEVSAVKKLLSVQGKVGAGA